MILYNKENKKIFMKESQLKMLTEALSDIVFHYTSIGNAYKMVTSDAIHFQSALGGTADNTNRKELFYLSLTRQRNANFGYSYKFRKDGARIEFDGRKLSTKFRGKAMDYWGSSMGLQSYYNGNRNDSFDSKQHHTSAESEDRLFSRTPTLYNAHEYIRRIDIVVDPTNETLMQYVYHMLMSPLNRLIFVYDNENDFNKQSDNIINKKITDYNSGNFEKYFTTKPNDRLFHETPSGELADVLKLMLVGDVDENNMAREASNLLKKYELSKYINSKLINNITNGYFNINELISKVSDEILGLSRRPTEDGQKIIKMFSDYFSKNGLKTYDDLRKLKVTKGLFSDYDSDRLIDKDKQVRFLTYKRGFDRILIPDPNKTSIWDIMDVDKETFASNLSYYAEGKHNSKDDDSFYKYAQHLTKNNISVIKMLNIVNKLGLSDDEKKELFDWGTFQYEDLPWYEAYVSKLPQFAKMNYSSYDKEYLKNKDLVRKYYFK